MSTTINHSKAERALDIAQARSTYDSEGLMRLARLEQKEENFELAEALRNEAIIIERSIREDFDDGREEREAYEVERDLLGSKEY
jgi:hypothetical protein